MAHLRRTSSVLETAWQRLAQLKSITPAPIAVATLTPLGTRLSDRKKPKARRDEDQRGIFSAAEIRSGWVIRGSSPTREASIIRTLRSKES